MADYALYRGPLLLAAGGGLQFLRARKALTDQYLIPTGIVAAITCYMLTRDYSTWASDPQLFVILTILGNAEAIGTLFGTTFFAAKAANSASEESKANNPFVPATNSK